MSEERSAFPVIFFPLLIFSTLLMSTAAADGKLSCPRRIFVCSSFIYINHTSVATTREGGG